MKVRYTVIFQEVKVRKYEVDKVGLQNCLRLHKNLSNLEISQRLNVPITKVEHWFRTDGSFSIPDASLWFRLKDILNISSTEFDSSVTEYIFRKGVYEKSSRLYFCDGLCPTLTTLCEHEKIIKKWKK